MNLVLRARLCHSDPPVLVARRTIINHETMASRGGGARRVLLSEPLRWS